MDLLKASLGLGKTIRNAGRLREMATVFGKNGFGEILQRALPKGFLGDSVPRSQSTLSSKAQGDQEWARAVGRGLRLSFEELGPSFVKFGQLLSTRDDVLPFAIIEELRPLRDQAKGIAYKEVLKSLKASLGRPVEEVFINIDKDALGTASIGVVHKATLKNGENVVIKVKRPGIDKQIETDLSLLSFIVAQLEKASEDLRFLGLSKAIYDFGVTLTNELDFNSERLNAERFEENLRKHDPEGLYIVPKYYPEFCGRDILVIELIDGVAFSSPSIKEYTKELEEKLKVGLGIFLKNFLSDGFFHADLHGGNFFYLKDGRIAIIDFGLMGSLSKKGRINFLSILYSLLGHNYENLVYEFLDVAEYHTIPDIDRLIADVRDALSPFVGLSVQQMNVATILKAITSTLSRHRLSLPREWYTVFRALITLDGVGKSLGIDFDIFGILSQDLEENVVSSFKKEDLIEEAVWASKDSISALRVIPRHLRWFLREFAKNNYSFKFQLKDLSMVSRSMENGARLIGLAFLSSSLIICGALTLPEGAIFNDLTRLPYMSLSFWSVAFILGLPLFFKKK